MYYIRYIIYNVRIRMFNTIYNIVWHYRYIYLIYNYIIDYSLYIICILRAYLLILCIGYNYLQIYFFTNYSC